MKIDENMMLNFIDEKVKESWIESCMSNSSLQGFSKQIYLQNGEFFITDNMSNNSHIEGENLHFITSIDSYIDLNYDNEIDGYEAETEWDFWGRDEVVSKLEHGLKDLNIELV